MNVTKSNIVFVSIIILLQLSLFSACIKKDSVDVQPVAAISIINVSAQQRAFDFYLDNEKVNTQPLIYQQSTEYIRIKLGRRKLTVTNVGDNNILLDDYIPVLEAKYYSGFLVQTNTVGTSQTNIEGIVVEDDVNPPSGNKAKVRFANFTNSDYPLNLSIIAQGSSESLFGNLGYKVVSPYREVEPGDKIFRLYDVTGRTLDVDLNLQQGRIYTFVTSSVWRKNQQADVMDTRLIANK